MMNFGPGTLFILVTGLGAATCARNEATGPADGTFVLRDNGVRCITSPCFSIEVVPADGGGSTRSVSDIDFGTLAVTPAERDSILELVRRGQSVVLEGRIESVPDAGPAGDGLAFRVSRLVGP